MPDNAHHDLTLKARSNRERAAMVNEYADRGVQRSVVLIHSARVGRPLSV